MKVVETTKQNQVNETENSASSLEFSDFVVYNEMADQTSVKLNLIEQIRMQLNQLEELNHKRQFLMKEILEVIR
jgi:hypothetical protein